MGLPVSSFRESCSEYTRLQSLLSCLNCRDAFSFAYDMAELGTDKQTQRSKSTEQGGSGPISWPQNVKETSRAVKFPQEDLKGLNYLDSFLKFVGIVFREPRND
jgi:hypothetical protein